MIEYIAKINDTELQSIVTNANEFKKHIKNNSKNHPSYWIKKIQQLLEKIAILDTNIHHNDSNWLALLNNTKNDHYNLSLKEIIQKIINNSQLRALQKSPN